MFHLSKQPLLQRERRPNISHRLYYVLIFACGLILIGALCEEHFRSTTEAAVSGNEIGAKELGIEGSGSNTPNSEAAAPAATNQGSPIRASPTLSSGSNSPIPHESLPAASPQSPGRSQSPLPSTKAGKEPVHEPSDTFGPSGVAGLGLTDIPPIGSNQAGPSGTNPLTDEYPAPGAPGLPPIPPTPPAAAPAAAAPGPPARCNDPENGFQKQVKSCGNFYFNGKENPGYSVVLLTYSTSQIVYLVDNVNGVCAGSKCVETDVDACCKTRSKCSPNFANDVHGGCPANMLVNIHQAAFCETSPCTIRDAGICCVTNPDTPSSSPAPSLLQYTGRLRSKYARSQPDLKSPVAKPETSFGYHDIAWFDMTKKRQVGTEEWAPLVNFFQYIGAPNNGWKTEAWMRISINGKMLYRPVPASKMGSSTPVSPGGMELPNV